jgi:two-component system CheB/CheR fusion protein
MTTAADPDATPNLEGVTILVVEDHDASRKAFCVIVRLFGATALPVRDGQEALAVASAQRPDLIFCDLRMPGMDGFELKRRLDADRALAGVPVVALSGLGSAEERDRIAQAGFAGHLLKPVSYDAIGAQLKQVFGDRR